MVDGMGLAICSCAFSFGLPVLPKPDLKHSLLPQRHKGMEVHKDLWLKIYELRTFWKMSGHFLL